jgi:hypothetical protein
MRADDPALLTADEFPRVATIPEVVQYIPSMRALVRNAKAVGMKMNDVFDTEIRSTKKGDHLLFFMSEFSLLVSSYDYIMTMLSLSNPGSVGTRAVPFKDPRLIFLIPIVLHFALNILAAPITSATADFDPVYITSETGVVPSDHFKLASLTDALSGKIPAADDWSEWDQSRKMIYLTSLHSALYKMVEGVDRTFFAPTQFSQIDREPKSMYDLLLLALSRSTAGCYKMDYREHEPGAQLIKGITIFVQVLRLSSGSAMTSIIGSFDNSGMLSAMYNFISIDLGAQAFEMPVASESETKHVTVRLSRLASLLEAKGLADPVVAMKSSEHPAANITLSIYATTTMGDDVLRITSIRVSEAGITSPYLDGYVAVVVSNLFTTYAEAVGGILNFSKSLIYPTATFVRRHAKLGTIVPRPSVLFANVERNEAVPTIQVVERWCTVLAEYVVRGADPRATRRLLIAAYAISAYERIVISKKSDFAQKWLADVQRAGVFAHVQEIETSSFVDGEERTETKDRVTYWYPFGNLFLSPEKGGVGYMPAFHFTSPSAGIHVIFNEMTRDDSVFIPTLESMGRNPSDPKRQTLAVLRKWRDALTSMTVLERLPPPRQIGLDPGGELEKQMLQWVRSFQQWTQSVQSPKMIENLIGHKVPRSAMAVRYPYRTLNANMQRLIATRRYILELFPAPVAYTFASPLRIKTPSRQAPQPPTRYYSGVAPHPHPNAYLRFMFRSLHQDIIDVLVELVETFKNVQPLMQGRTLFRGSSIPDAYEMFVRTVPMIRPREKLFDELFIAQVFEAIAGIELPSDRLPLLNRIVMSIFLNGGDGANTYNDSLMRFATPPIQSPDEHVGQTFFSLGLILADLRPNALR